MRKIKYFLWKIFKSPERKIVGWKTLFIDIFGHILIFSNFNKLQPITICIGVKNRSHNLLNLVIHSINHCKNKELITISIFDCGSNDILNLNEALKDQWKGELIYSEHEQIFARSEAFNNAILQAKSKLILACDADIYLPKDLVKKVNKNVTSRSSWFPIVWWQAEDELNGRYFTEGTGIFASTKNNFIKSGKYDENIIKWGKEDWMLYFSFYRKGIACIRTREREMVHHYHESLKPSDFKSLF